MNARRLLVVLVALPACADDLMIHVPCDLGTRDAAPELELVHLDRSFALQPTQPNAEVPLHWVAQTGQAVMLGVRATNLDGCELTMTASLRAMTGTDVLASWTQPTLLEPDGGGWGTSAMAPLTLCPQLATEGDLHDQPYRVTVEIEDRDGRYASRELVVVPVCPADDRWCACECSRDFVLGRSCT